jgi:acetate kinase
MSKMVLVLNAGSSSIKFTVYDSDGAQLTMRYTGEIEQLGNQPHLLAKDAQGQVVEEHRWKSRGADDHRYALERLSNWLEPLLDEAGLIGVGHRVVHGGPEYSAPTLITEQVVARLESYVPLAPLHQPANLAGIRAAAEFLPGVPQIACFDTAFHRQHPRVADQFALPVEFYDQGVRRYGFHGLSYEYIVRRLPDVAPEIAQGRVVVAHLGNGASMCAIRAGRSIDTTMSFTPLDGLPMGTRCGDLDPGVLLYLLQEKGMRPQQVQDLLYKRSGLLGMSGISNDMRALLASADPRAHQAVDYFVYRIGRELGALTAALGGLDGFVFTAGIGENAAEIRARVCRSAHWLGIELDEAANRRHGPRISSPNSHVSVWVVPTDEDRLIALHTLAALQ